MKTTIKYLLLSAMFIATLSKIHGQNFKMDSVVFDIPSEDTTISLVFVEVSSPEGITGFGNLMDSSLYPFVILEKGVFMPGTKIVQGLEDQIRNYMEKEIEWKKRENIYQEEKEVLNRIIGWEKQRTENQKEANIQLNQQISSLSTQLNLSTDIAEKSLKDRNRKNIHIGILGGVAGFTLGALIGMLAAN